MFFCFAGIACILFFHSGSFPLALANTIGYPVGDGKTRIPVRIEVTF